MVVLVYDPLKSITMVPKNMQVHFYLNTPDNCSFEFEWTGLGSAYEFSKIIIESHGNENEYLQNQKTYMEELSPAIVDPLNPSYSSRRDPPAISGRFAKKTYSELKNY